MATSPTGPLGLRLSSLIRAGGTTATLLSGRSPGFVRAGVLAGGAHLAAREIDPAGIQVLSITPGGDVDIASPLSGRAGDSRSRAVQDLSSTVSWVGTNMLLARLARLLPFSRPLSAVLLGAGVYLADDYVVAMVDKHLQSTDRDTSPQP